MQKCCIGRCPCSRAARRRFVSPELDAGQTVNVVVHEFGMRGRPIMEILDSGAERRLFRTADEVRAYLAEAKASWDR